MPHVSAGENVAVLFEPRAIRARERRGGARRPYRHLPGQSGLRLLNLAQAVAVVAYEWFKHASGSALLSGCPSDRSRLASSRSRRSSPISSVSSISSNISGRSTSERPCWSICAIFSRACSRPGRTSRPCTAWWWRSPRVARGRRAAVLDGEEAAALRAAGRVRRRPCPWRAWPGAWPGAAPPPQPDRGRAGALAGTHRRPSPRWNGLQAANAGRQPHRRFRLLPVAYGNRSAAGGRNRREQRIAPIDAPG